MSPAVAALNIGVGPCWGKTCGDMLEAMARITPSQPNEPMARIAPRRNGTISLDPSLRVLIPKKGSLDIDSKLFSKIKINSKKGLGSAVLERVVRHHQSVSQSPNPTILRAA